MLDAKLSTYRLTDRERVNEVLARFPEYDIHYDPRYLRLFEEFTKQEALYVHYQDSEGEFLLAFFERTLPDAGTGNGKDLISPWYYGGPLHTFADDAAAKKRFPEFLEAFHAWCLEQGVVTEFQRLNPVLGNHELYGDDPALAWNRNVVSIDLTKSIETIFLEYERDVRRSIRRCEDAGIRVATGVDADAIATFVTTYTDSMERKTASDFYHFNDAFYADLFKSFPEAQLFTVYSGDAVVSSELVLGRGKTLYHYLRGSYPEHRSLRTNGYAIHAMVAWAKEAGYTEFNMGGGLSGAADDSLFLFKKSLSPLLRDYYLYKKVHNHEAYQARAQASGKEVAELRYEAADFFPEYRTS